MLAAIAFVVAAAAGLGAGYLMWGQPTNWYAADVTKLGQGPENDLVRYGRDLIVNTPRHIGKNATDPALRLAGNDLACQSCHLNAGLQPFAAPFVSTFASYPMLVDDQVLTLTDRINGCMRRSMNGKDLPSESREMEALIAYIKFVGKGSPEGVRVPGMGLKSIHPPTQPPDARRGEEVYAKLCVTCHKEDGQGELRRAPASAIPSRRSGGRRASMGAPAWPRPPMPPPTSTTTCPSVSIIGRRCSRCSRPGTWRPS